MGGLLLSRARTTASRRTPGGPQPGPAGAPDFRNDAGRRGQSGSKMPHTGERGLPGCTPRGNKPGHVVSLTRDYKILLTGDWLPSKQEASLTSPVTLLQSNGQHLDTSPTYRTHFNLMARGNFYFIKTHVFSSLTIT